MTITELAKSITRGHAAGLNVGPQVAIELRKLVNRTLVECQKVGFNPHESGDLLTGRILEKFDVREK